MIIYTFLLFQTVATTAGLHTLLYDWYHVEMAAVRSVSESLATVSCRVTYIDRQL